MSYYSTDSDEHLINTGAKKDPYSDPRDYDWLFEDPVYLYYSSEDEGKDCELDPEVEAHNDEVMAASEYLEDIDAMNSYLDKCDDEDKTEIHDQLLTGE